MVSATALVVSEKGGPFERAQVELDSLRPNEVLVQLKATGICHTDLAVQHGHIPMPFPVVLGHEGAGIVLETGADVTDVQQGDHVVLSYNYCGKCHSCRTGHMWHCTHMFAYNFGGQRQDGSTPIKRGKSSADGDAALAKEGESLNSNFFGQSSFCNPAIVQSASLVKIDKSLPLDVVCAMGCGFQTGAGSVFNVIKPVENKVRSLAIFGAGGVGFAAIMAAVHLSDKAQDILSTIIAIDIADERLELTKKLGVTHTVNSAKEDLKARINEITDGEGLDAAVDCTGVIPVVADMIALVGPGGLAVTVGGPPPGKTVAVDVFGMLTAAKTYRGCHQGNAYSKEFIPFLAKLYQEGRLPVEKLQRKYPVADFKDALEDMIKGRVVKPILVWD
ncbi:hypothetical protein AAFC00_006554 [Neodothiora populina]|uniref:Enoyl reductase (ER) domain-containing protein n=1 Tax=Neodothiora populina TaxID=2781224 RepID=A0ABR3PAC5_9PEZI